MKAVDTDLGLARQRYEISKGLLEEGLTPKIDHLTLQAEMERLIGQLSVLRQSVPRAEAALAEAKALKDNEIERFKRRALEELSDVERKIAETGQSLNQANEQQQRAVIRSPIDGIIKNMRYHTIGGVVKPGEPIMEIVPVSDELVIQAKLNPIDRGYVEVGQHAVVKISTYDYSRYGGLEGKVERIGASTNTDSNGHSYYEVVIKTRKTYLGDSPDQYVITPGMQATVDIHTGTRTVLDYLIRPVLKLRHEAFRER